MFGRALDSAIETMMVVAAVGVVVVFGLGVGLGWLIWGC